MASTKVRREKTNTREIKAERTAVIGVTLWFESCCDASLISALEIGSKKKKIKKNEATRWENNETWLQEGGDVRLEAALDTGGDYSRTLTARKKQRRFSTRQLWRKICSQFHYFCVTLSYYGTREFPDRHLISGAVLGTETISFFCSNKARN